MFHELQEMNQRPEPFQFYTASELWTNEHTSQRMLECHLNESIDAASRNIHFIDHSVEWMIEHFQINHRSNIIDFGCGPGLYTSRLAKTGAKITGIDFSRRSLHYAQTEAQKNSLNIDYIYSDYLEFDSNEKYDLITMIFCDFTVLSPAQRKKLLEKFQGLLKPNGSILFDVFSLNYFQTAQEVSTYEPNPIYKFWSPNEYYCFMNR